MSQPSAMQSAKISAYITTVPARSVDTRPPYRNTTAGSSGFYVGT